MTETLEGSELSCRKSETELSLLYEQSCAFTFQDQWFASRDANAGRKREEKFFNKIPRNPLISPDSDERIQGNPTVKRRGFRNEMAASQENPSADRPDAHQARLPSREKFILNRLNRRALT